MSSALTDMVVHVTRTPSRAENVLSLTVDEALFDKVKRRERTMALRPANKYWNDHLKGIQYTHVKLFAPSGRALRIAFKGATRRSIAVAPDKRATFWEISL